MKSCLSLLVLMLALFANTAEAGLHAQAGATFCMGKMKSETGSIVSRNINVIGLRGMLGWSFGSLTLGPAAEYRLVGQTTAVADAGRVNLGGAGYLVGGGLSLVMGRWLMRGSYDFFGTHQLSTKTAAGDTFSYKSPAGFGAALEYSLNQRVALDLVFSSHKYKKITVGAADGDISSDALAESTYGAGLSVLF